MAGFGLATRACAGKVELRIETPFKFNVFEWKSLIGTNANSDPELRRFDFSEMPNSGQRP